MSRYSLTAWWKENKTKPAREQKPQKEPTFVAFQRNWDNFFVFCELFQKCGTVEISIILRKSKQWGVMRKPDSKQVASHQTLNLFGISKRCRHHLRLVSVLLVIVEYSGHTLESNHYSFDDCWRCNFIRYLHTRVIMAIVLLLIRILHKPVHNSAHKWRN